MLKDLGKTKSCPMVRDHHHLQACQVTFSAHEIQTLDSHNLSLLIPSYCWTSHAGFGGLWCLSGAPRHMLKELALLVVVCLYVTCGQKVRVQLWCSARMDE